jgi:starch-binding outer membrane protein, SusD/RagB family
MKKILNVLLAGILLLQTSCFDALDISQQSQVSSADMWQSEEDAQAAVYGMFHQFRVAFSSNSAYWGDYRTGVYTTTQTLAGDILDANSNTIDANNQAANWGDLYKLINISNLIIRHTPDISFNSEEDKNNVMANAYFTRAFAYFWIARIWGDAPLLLHGFESDENEKLFPTRTPADSLFSQVEKDIDLAVACMPASATDHTLATPAAVNMLKADYNLWMAKVRATDETQKSSYFAKAQEGLTQVLTNANYELASDYSLLFNASNKEATKEILFAIRFVKDEYEGGFAKNYLLSVNAVAANDKKYVGDGTSSTIVVGTEGSLAQRVTLTTACESFLFENTKDQRAKVTYPTVTYSKKYHWINKYIGSWITQTRIFDSDIIVYRLADAILFQAELYNATAQTDKAISSLNQIAKRAYGEAAYYKDTLSTAEVEKYIMDERVKEFTAECKLWWDMIRMGVVFDRVATLKGRESAKNILLWPIHYDALNANPNLEQTEF